MQPFMTGAPMLHGGCYPFPFSERYRRVPILVASIIVAMYKLLYQFSTTDSLPVTRDTVNKWAP